MVEHAAHHAPSVADLFFPAINFGLFVLLGAKYLPGPVREFFRSRTQQIRDGLAAGARAQQEADKLRKEIEADLRDLPALRERLARDLRVTAEQQRDRLLAQGRATAERIRKDAALQAEQEVAAARQHLRVQVIHAAVAQATDLVTGAVTADDQSRFVRDFVSSAGAAS